MSTNESSLPPPPHPSFFLPSQSKGRLSASLLVATAGTRGPSVQTCTAAEPGGGDGGGEERCNWLIEGWGFNERQPVSALFGRQIIAGWCSIILQPEIAVKRKVEGGGGGGGGEGEEEEEWREPRNPGRVPEGKKGLANAIIIFKNITAATTAAAKNRLESARRTEGRREERGGGGWGGLGRHWHLC